MRRPLALAVALAGGALMLAACTSTVSGHPSAEASTPPSSAPPRFPSSSTPPTLPPIPTPIPIASGPVGGCSITDQGAPFCYPLPTGFTDFSRETDYARAWRWKTLVSIGRHDLIEVLGQPIGRNLDGMTGAQARAYVATFALRRGSGGVTRVTPLAATRVDGARAFRQFVTYTSGVHAYAYNVLRGHNVVYISCQYTAGRVRTVLTACAQVLGSIKIRNL